MPFLGHSSSHLWCRSCSPVDYEDYDYNDNVVQGGNDGENSTCLDLEKFIVSDECGKLGTALSVTQEGFGLYQSLKTSQFGPQRGQQGNGA